jgi:hypothetical protein
MRIRLESLRRLASVYAAIEEMHSIEWQRTAAAIRETQLAIVREHQEMRSIREDGCRALLEGDNASRILAEAQNDAATWRRQALEQIRLKRETLNVSAREQYMASRVKSEQVGRIFRDMAAHIEIEERRRTQALSDDRFLARRGWTDAQRKARDDA